MSCTPEILTKEQLAKMAKRREQAELLTRLAVGNSMQHNLHREDALLWQHQKAQHKQEHGETMPDDDDTINNTFDSPVTHNHHQNGGSLGTTLATLALGGILGGGGLALGALAMQLLADKPDAVAPVTPVTPGGGETLEIGLGRIEDYLKP